MFAPLPDRRVPVSTWVSGGGHVLGVVAIVLLTRMHPVRVFSLPGTASGTHVALAYLPGSAPAPELHAPSKVKPRSQSPAQVSLARRLDSRNPSAALMLPALPHLTVTEVASSANVSAPASATPDSTSGTDSWGSGAVEIALTTYSPSPKPDLSVLPHGIQGDVIVDVTIDPSGKVADLAVLHTLGYGIESSVIGTLRTWTFRPATKDGAPIASVQELHFHFGPV